jgi:hypothetical protein
MKTYKRKSNTVKAIQWNKHGDHGLVSKNGDNGIKWEYSPHCSLCGKLPSNHGYIETVHGGKIICPGTWIVERDDGIQTYSTEEFNAKYEVVE